MKRGALLIHKPAEMKDCLGLKIVLCSAVFMILTQSRALANFDSESHGYYLTIIHTFISELLYWEER